MKIIIDNKIPFIKGVLENFCDIEYLPSEKITGTQVKRADGLIIRTRTKCNRELLKDSNIKIIATATIGFDHIDTHYCDTHSIQWYNAPGCNSGSVQQYIASALIRISEKYQFNLKDITLGIIGVGHVGSKVEKLAQTLEIKVLLNDPPRERNEQNSIFLPLDFVLTHSDIVTVHVPLSYEGIDKTYRMVNTEFLNKMKSGSVLINTSRGEVVHETELISALKDNKISGAVLDVFENEPQINTELLSLIDIGTSHIAGYSRDGKANATAAAVNRIAEFFNFPLNNWYPEWLIQPENNLITLDSNDFDEFEIIKKVILHTYDILKDHFDLAHSPRNFERLRVNYWNRREFKAFTINMETTSQSIKHQLKSLGFHVT
ncbi:4-phosphoerythronate dehydrogenase [Bacteroidota bacterium]